MKITSNTNFVHEGERRHATVLFGDISDFTSMSEKMDPEEVTLIVNECLKCMSLIIEKNEGTIDKFMGDCVMALFGLPAAVEDAPFKALNAAIEIRNMIDQFNKSKKLTYPLGVHLGINTGIVITGSVGSANVEEHTVIGDTVNVASRLKDVSKTGQIYVGSATYNQTKRYFDYKELDRISLKGKEEPVPVYELISKTVKILKPETEPDRMIFSEMVGRDKELDKLSLHLLEVINGSGSIIGICGEAGIGKSRLIAELRKRDEIKRIIYLEGRAFSYGRNLSYHPIIEILKQWTGIKDHDTALECYRKLEKTIRAVYAEEIMDVFPFIATLMGMELTGSYADRLKGVEGDALEKLVVMTLRDIIEKITSIRPVVFVLDDLQWADLSSIEFLKSLCRLAESKPIFFIFLFRPDYQDTSEKLVSTIKERYNNIFDFIQIESLGANQSEALINNLTRIDGLPADIISLITKRSGGNPFFIEEILRSFIDDGIIVIQNNKFQITERINTVVIPETIHEVLMARIDKLDDKTRSLIKIASVIGRNFFYKVLVEVAATIGEIDQRLDYLEGIQLIRKQQHMYELEYLFKHALAQEATYESILVRNRKELHLKTAVAIESVFSQRLHEFYGMLALHYSKGEDLDKAEEYLIKAGEEALKVSASSEALNFYKEALTIYLKKYGDAVERLKIAELEKNIGLAFNNKGQLAEALDCFDKVFLFYGIKAPKGRLSVFKTVLIGFGGLLISLYLPFIKWREKPSPRDINVIKLFFNKLNCIGVIAPNRLVPEAFNFYRLLTRFDLAQLEMGSGMFSGASVLFTLGGVSFALSRRVLKVIKNKILKDDFKSKIYYGFAEILDHYHSGRWATAGKHDMRLVDSTLKIGELLYTTYYVHVHALMNIKLGNYDIARQLIDKLAEIGKKFEHNFSQGLYFFTYTILLNEFGMIDEAIRQSVSGLEFLRKIDDKVYLFRAYSLNANLLLKTGDLQGAKTSLDNAKSIKLINPLPSFQIDYFDSMFIYDINILEKAIILNNTQSLHVLRKRALQSGKRAVKITQKVARNQTMIYLNMGIFNWIMNHQHKAIQWWRKSISTGQRLKAKLDLSRVYMEIGKRLLESKSKFDELNGITATEYLGKAKSLFEEMNLQWDLNEFEKLKLAIHSK